MVAGAFGVRGEVRIKSFTEPPENIAAYGDLRSDPGGARLALRGLRPVKNGFAGKFEGVDDRDAAERLKGVRLTVPRTALPAAEDEDEFYVVDLVGCRAWSESGTELGMVTAVHDFGAGPLLEIGGGGRTELYRFTRDSVPAVDVGGKTVVVADTAIAKEDET